MKVLAIRGRNLASLAGDFAVDFTRSPLADAGLFAITGPTGSGKSTLLDALCLALYDRTPRLEGIGRGAIPDPSGERLAPGDVRALLRRGCGDGFAEVDFVGVDGEPCRARWSIRRARGGKTGKLQASTMSLSSLSSSADLGGSHKTEVLASIERRIGLGFAQFTRAVLLAQNEFTAFLKADDTERAQLLELLTGTERFSRLSMRVHQRARQANLDLEQRRSQAQSQAPLPDDARSALDQQVAQAARLATELASQQSVLAAQLRRHDALDAARLAEHAAEKSLESVRQQHADASARRQRLAQVDAVQTARPLLDDVHRLVTEGALAHEERQSGLAALALASTQAQAAHDAARAASDAHATAIKSQADAAPRLALARQIAGRLAHLQPARDAAQEQATTAATAAASAESALASHRQATQARTKSIASEDAWLKAHALDAALATQWPRWHTMLQQAQTTHQELNALTAARATLARAFEHAHKLLDVARQQQAECRQQVVEAETRLRALTEVPGPDPDAIANRRHSAEARREQAQNAQACWQELAGARADCATLSSHQAATAATIAEHERALAAASSARPGAEAARAQADRALALARTAAGETAEKLRATLVPGEACPVCGAADHPYADDETPLRRALAALEGEAKASAARLAGLDRDLAQAEAGRTAETRRQDEVAKQLASARSRLAHAQSSWAAEPLAAQAPSEAAATAPWLAELLAAAQAELATVAKDEQQRRELLTRREDAQRALDQARKSSEHSFADLSGAENNWRNAQQQLAAADEKATGLAARRDSLLSELEPAFSREEWRSQWSADPASFASHAQDRAAAWSQADARRKALADEEAASAATEPLLLQAREEAARRVTSANESLGAAGRDLSRALAELAECLEGLGGSEPGIAEKQLNDRVREAHKHSTQAANEAAQAQAGLASTKATAEQAALRCTRLATELAHADAALTNWLATHPLGEAELTQGALEALLGIASTELTQEREALLAIDTALTNATAICAERTRVRRGHEESAAGDPPRTVAEAARTALEQTSREALEQRARLQAQQLQDDDRRSATASLAKEITACAGRALLWGKLDALVGSSDGRKFRNIAQQMTLDVLLGYANRHLESLARRYRLQRIEESLGLMVIDHEMGDESRSVHSLSGGESFLVSLALALALASISSQRVRVESLFIDEGFGSLDPDALRIAMEALDGLQAHGRKVGVITHVQEMAEQIAVRIQVKRASAGRSSIGVATLASS